MKRPIFFLTCAVVCISGINGGTLADDGVAPVQVGAPKVTAGASREPVTIQQFTPDGRPIMTAAQDGTARIWDVATGRNVGVMQAGNTNRIAAATNRVPFSVQFTPDGKRIITTHQDGSSQVWDAATGRPALPRYDPGMVDNMPVVGPDNFARLQKQIDALEKRVSELEKKLSERK